MHGVFAGEPDRAGCSNGHPGTRESRYQSKHLCYSNHERLQWFDVCKVATRTEPFCEEKYHAGEHQLDREGGERPELLRKNIFQKKTSKCCRDRGEDEEQYHALSRAVPCEGGEEQLLPRRNVREEQSDQAPRVQHNVKVL